MSDSEQSISSESSLGEHSSDKKSISKPKKAAKKGKGKIVLNISDCQYPVVSKVAKNLGWKIQKNSQATDWDIFWTDNAVQPQVLLRMEPHQKINHFPGMYHLARKNLMGRYLMKMRKQFPEDYNFFPMTWMLPIQYHELRNYFETKQKGKARTFIVKPEAMSQGKGIFLTRKLEDIEPGSHCVVQRYLHKPYLIQGLKFDLRIYVLIASVDPLRIYIYEQGLTRFATQKYQPPTRQNMEDTCMHLTNYAINKDNPKFVFNNNSKDMTKGHKRSLQWFYTYIAENQPDKAEEIKQKINQLIVKTMISGLPPINNQYRSCQPENHAANMCFQLLGFDVLLTEKCQPVLLQINHTPSFSTDTPLDNLIKTNFIRDSLELMNINVKTKNQIIRVRKQICQQRVITGKKVRLTLEQRQEHRRVAQETRDKYEGKHLGGFTKIYPSQNPARQEKYEQFLKFSEQNYLNATGMKNKKTNIAKNQKIQSAFGTCISRKNKDSSLINMNQKQSSPKRNLLKKTDPHKHVFSDKMICSKNYENNDVQEFQNQLVLSVKTNSKQSNSQEQQEQYKQLEKLAKSQNNLFKKLDKKVFQLKKQCSDEDPSTNNINQFPISEPIQPQSEQDFNNRFGCGKQYIKARKHEKQNTINSQHPKQNESPCEKTKPVFCQNTITSKKISQQLGHQEKKYYQFVKEKQYKNPTNIGIYFEPANIIQEQNNLLRNAPASSSGQRKNQKRGVSVGFMATNANKTTVNPINSVRKTSTKNNNNTYSTVSYISASNTKPKQLPIENGATRNTNKIPITLNTLLINGYDSKTSALSAHNLRKILSIGSNEYNPPFSKNINYK